MKIWGFDCCTSSQGFLFISRDAVRSKRFLSHDMARPSWNHCRCTFWVSPWINFVRMTM